MADNSLPYFIMGVGVGAALGILLAPQSGEETREDLLRRADEGREYVRRTSGELRERAGEVVEQGRGAVDAQRGQLHSAFEAGRKAYREAGGGNPEDKTETAAAS